MTRGPRSTTTCPRRLTVGEALLRSHLRFCVVAATDTRHESAMAQFYDRPYVEITAPRVTRFSGEARKRIVAATSSTLGHASWLAFGMAWRFCGVSMIEGATAFTRIPFPTTSCASASVSAATAALLT